MNIRKFFSSIARRVLYNRLVYKIYERILWYQIKDGKKPDHIGVILDGNRRWAIDHLISPWMGHQYGADKVEELLDWCLELDVKTITLYAFSTENFERPTDEVNKIFSIIDERLKKILSDERIQKNEIQTKEHDCALAV